MPQTPTRRPIKSRSSKPIMALARYLAAGSVTPNQISSASVVFAMIGALALLFPNWWWAAIVAIGGIQLRLICNVVDGLVAVEGGRKSTVGPLYNEFPDRIADSVLLIAAGYATPWPTLGWAAALVAALTAYVRVFGSSVGLAQRFLGPMAKQHRMAVLSAACAGTAIEDFAGWPHYCLLAALILIIAGSVVTCGTRTMGIVRDIRDAAAGE